ncbi:metallophosphoesterase [Arthrobacter castelli]|uniref:metallophosphoesterase n=1 Tax=Arthrobacter castelli TaxID=271431 RepID=UPI0003FDB6A7|nr:metallophosphoesterase [Arthrobacter castelli]
MADQRKRGTGAAAATAAATTLAGVAGLGAFLYASVIERNWFTLREESIDVLPPGQRPRRILHISDIHMAPAQIAKTDWLRTLADLKPDLVVNTGDNLGDKRGMGPLLEALEPLLQYPGVFVPGSNDYYAPTFKNPAAYLFRSPGSRNRSAESLPTGEMHEAFGRAGWVNLANRSQSVVLNRMRMDFSGVDDPHLGRDHYVGFPNGSVSQHGAPNVQIGVAHAPYQRVLDDFADGGAHLVLAGHTHGGQLRIPGYGALVSNSDLPTWRARGLTRWSHGPNNSWINVSAGIGTSKFAPVRFACRPEAVLITLNPTSGR